MIDLDRAVQVWLEAKAMFGQDCYPKPLTERRAIRERRKQLYTQANELAGGNRALLAELTRRGLITWAF